MTLTANGSGTITGKFALSGSAAVKTATFTGSNGSVAKGILFASSFIGEATNKKHLSAESVIFSAPDIDDVVPLFQVVTPLLSGEVSGISLFVINKGSSFISVQLRDVVNGLPDKVLSTSVLQSSVLTDNTWTNFLFSVPVPVSIGSDYAICIHCSDATGEVAVLDLTQQATSHSPNIKGFGASFDGIDYQLYKNKKLSFKLLMASYTSNSRSIPLGDVSVNDVSRLLVFSPTSRNIGGVASSRLLLTLPDLSVIEALDGQVVKLPSSVTGSISIVRQLYANSRFSHKGVGGSQLVVGDIVDVASYVSGRIKTEDGCRLRLDVVGSVPDGSGVLTYVSDADTVNWELMTLVGSPEPQGAGVFKYSYLSDVIFGTNDIVFRVRLNGTSDAVPVIKSVSAETVFTYVYALKNGDPLNRFKVADGVDEDDAASIGQLRDVASSLVSESETREDANLSLSIALAAEITNRENADNTKANLGGSNAQIFKMANGVTLDDGVNLGQLVQEGVDRVNGDISLAISLAAQITRIDNLSNYQSSVDIWDNGYFTFPSSLGGLKIQFGKRYEGHADAGTITFPQAFPTRTLHIGITNFKNIDVGSGDGGNAVVTHIKTYDLEGFTYSSGIEAESDDVFHSADIPFFWFAIGH